MNNLINTIAHNFKGYVYYPEYEDIDDKERAKRLQDVLEDVCGNLSEATQLLHNKPVNIEYLLSIVSSYLIGIQDGSISTKDTLPPYVLFEENLLPNLENTETVLKETIEEPEQSDDTKTNE